MSEERYNRNEIIADDLDDRASHGTSKMRRRIDREVVRVEEQQPQKPINEKVEIEATERITPTKDTELEECDKDSKLAEDTDDAEGTEVADDSKETEESKEGDQEKEAQRPKRLIDHIITGSLLTDGTVPYYRYFIAIAVMCFLSIVLTFLSLNASNEYRRKERMVTTLHERSVIKDEQRYGLSSKSAITERLLEHNIELVDLSKDSRLIEK